MSADKVKTHQVTIVGSRNRYIDLVNRVLEYLRSTLGRVVDNYTPKNVNGTTLTMHRDRLATYT